jgi:hypothetical protein
VSNLVNSVFAAVRRAYRRRAFRDDRGISLVEVMVATSIFSIGVLGIVGTMGSSLSLVGNSRQRSSAVAVAQERLERVHTIPYDRVALYCGCQASTTPAHSTDTSNPDNAITTDNSSYVVDGSHTEPLIFDSTNGAIKHIDDPVTVGHTEFNIYQYVTWYDDPQVAGTQDYKRIVVVVTWKFPVETGRTNRVFQSTFVGNGTVTVPVATIQPTASPGSTSTPTPTPIPTASGCGNASPPNGSISVLSGAGAVQGYTNSTNVQVTLTATGCSPITASLSNDGSTFSPVATLASGASATVTWTVPATDGTKTIYTMFTGGGGRTSPIYTGTIVLDKTAPTKPANVRAASCSISGNNRIVSLTWNASTDTNLVGYRVYKSINQATFTALTTTASQSASDTDSKGYNSVTYRVTAYDKAGNESGVPNDLSFSKNSC